MDDFAAIIRAVHQFPPFPSHLPRISVLDEVRGQDRGADDAEPVVVHGADNGTRSLSDSSELPQTQIRSAAISFVPSSLAAYSSEPLNIPCSSVATSKRTPQASYL